MKTKMKKTKVIAILTADIHLSHKPPVWRSNEPDWYAAMGRALNEIDELSVKYDCNLILCAGDIFDKWNSPPELINFSLNFLHTDNANMWAIAGQHDVPNHNYDNIYQSAYCTLDHAGKINNLLPNTNRWIDSDDFSSDKTFRISAFPFGTKIKAILKKEAKFEIAIVHKYVWTGRAKYPTAPKEAKIETRSSKMIKGKLYGYDVIVYGDNHKGFITHVGKTTVFNCGTLMRRRSDEEDYRPQVGLLYTDGTVEPYYLDISKDKHLTAEEVKDVEEIEQLDMELFAKELRKLGASALDFSEAMKEFWRSDKTRKAVRHIITKAMEK